MKKEHIDCELYEILHFTPEATPDIQDKINAAYEQILNSAAPMAGKGKKKRPYLYAAAALILAFGFWGFSNPALAGKIPFIGRIFQLVETNIGYPGNFSEHSVPITPPETELEESDADAEDITITLSEASYTEMALYFSLELYSKEGFPEDFNKVKNMEGYILPYDFLYIQCSQSFDFSQADSSLYDTDNLTCSPEEGMPVPYLIEGNYMDSHTFLGVVRVDLEDIRNVLEVDALPPEFTYSFTLHKFWGTLKDGEAVDLTDPESGETVTIMVPLKKYYDGPWNFTVPVSIDTNNTQTIDIMQTNADGIGISKVTKTPYEMKADIILPDGADPIDYIIAITDADGKLLDSQGNNAEIYSVYGRKTDTVYIYVVDYFTFMDECKADNAYLLPEKALFQTTVVLHD